MKDIDIALSQISSIRAQMAANTRFLGISPEFNLVMAVLALVVALVQSQFAAGWGQGAFSYLALWIAVIVASSTVVAIDAVSRTRRLHGVMARDLLKGFLLTLLPFGIAGVVFTGVICLLAPENIWMLPGMWQIILGLLGFAAVSRVPKGLIFVATWYLLSGSVVLWLAAESKSLSAWMMGLPFFVGQLAAALLLMRANGEAKPAAEIKGGRHG